MDVLIIGGGVAGLSAAHELVLRGYKVKVVEAKSTPGGKAKSVNLAGTGINGKQDLPGEHGFRFFPGFYKHITDTMQQIPYGNGKTVLNNLVPLTTGLFSIAGAKDITAIYKFPTSFKEVKTFIQMFYSPSLAVKQSELNFLALKIWQYLTSCEPRRKHDYEKISWWEFIQASNKSTAFKKLLVDQTRTLVAAKPKKISADTSLKVAIRLFNNILSGTEYSDRILNGPTNDVWINPWLEYLKSKGLEYVSNLKAININLNHGVISGVDFEEVGTKDGSKQTFSADYYIFAVPVERMVPLLSEQVLELDGNLNNLVALSQQVDWMNGIQFYLNEDAQIVKGHCLFLGSEWALTAISQAQFWPDFPMSGYAGGNVKGIISVDISDWEVPGKVYNKSAKECSPQEIATEVWEQIKSALNDDCKEVIKDEYLESWFIDPSIETSHTKHGQLHNNAEPLLVNQPDSWQLRPHASTKIPNMFLAADYVRTNTDLASMEGANEAAKTAVNHILKLTSYNGELCKIYDFAEPEWLNKYKQQDLDRFNSGLPWQGELPLLARLTSKMLGVIYKK